MVRKIQNKVIFIFPFTWISLYTAQPQYVSFLFSLTVYHLSISGMHLIKRKKRKGDSKAFSCCNVVVIPSGMDIIFGYEELHFFCFPLPARLFFSHSCLCNVRRMWFCMNNYKVIPGKGMVNVALKISYRGQMRPLDHPNPVLLK